MQEPEAELKETRNNLAPPASARPSSWTHSPAAALAQRVVERASTSMQRAPDTRGCHERNHPNNLAGGLFGR
eukprot:744525-Lingulodinium_polyedra.AAC.1